MPREDVATGYRQDPMSFFSEEVALHILELLSPADLGKCACVSTLWHRLVNDQMLWRRLFLKYHFEFPRGIQSLGVTQRRSSLKRSISFPYQYQSARSGTQDQYWKSLYKLNYNWIIGQARVIALSVQDLLTQDELALSRNGGRTAISWEDERVRRCRHPPIVQFKGSILLVVSPGSLVHLWRIRSSPTFIQFWQTYRCSRTEPGVARREQDNGETHQITSLTLDSSTDGTTGWQKVMVGFRSGHFSVFEYFEGPSDSQDGTADIEQAATLREIGRTEDLPAQCNLGCIQSASFQYPILTTFSDDGSISIYSIQSTPSSVDRPHTWCRLLHRLYGTPTQSPVQIELSRLKPHMATTTHGQEGVVGRWRALISFGLQLYDASWTIRLQEIEFDERFILNSSETGTAEDTMASSDDSTKGNVGSESTTPPFFKSTISCSEASSCPPVVGHTRIGSISAISIAWPLVVTTHNDNTMNVFQMTRSLDGNTHGWSQAFDRTLDQDRNGAQDDAASFCSAQQLHFYHLSTLYGHCGAVSSVSIESRSGRLVSASMDRSIKVWTLATKDQEAVVPLQGTHRCAVSMSDINKSWTEAGQVTKEEGLGLVWVGSDEEKIVSMNCDGTIKIWHFT
ncbi:hypothetical protein BG011_004666 [Mortierella polycephala]|uniref:F-box domain-containing protein n=1 Tax=Mortierella polycephala TaxID=41804 RepID=A0A9P6U9H6_9FUNG|nr:hypothetical protein BG011_004666 [Mortierella polycephala]